MLEQSYYEKTDDIIAMHGAKSESLIPIIQDIQAEYRYLPAELLCYVAKKIGITEAKAFSVATFYENLSFEPKGKYVIKVCDDADALLDLLYFLDGIAERLAGREVEAQRDRRELRLMRNR